MFKKIVRLIRRDGFTYTLRRVLAYAIAHSPLAYKASYSYYKNTRLVFAPALLCYSTFANKHTRQQDMAVFEKFVTPGSTVIDAGSNIGTLTVIAGTLAGKDGKVLAFEPSSKFAHITRKNVKVNRFDDRTAIHQVALGEKEATVFLDESPADDTTNYISDHGTKVHQLPLDHFTNDIKEVDLLKIDVEGYEHAALKGAPVTLKKTKVLYIEFLPSLIKRNGKNPQDVLDIIKENFTVHTLNQDGSLKTFTYDAQATTHPDLVCINVDYTDYK